MRDVPGTSGYGRAIDRFVEVSQSLDFHVVCADFVAFLPGAPARILDVGAGAGQNSAALAQMGYSVVAVEPVAEFLAAALEKYSVQPVTWIQDSLPLLANLKLDDEKFDVVLVEAVWHHLNPQERIRAFQRLGPMLSPRGKLAMSLRNGPAGLGTRVFPTDPRNTIELAVQQGMKCILRKENLPSLLPGKEEVVWSRLVFEKV